MIDTIEKYRLFDLTMLSILAIVCEIIGEISHITLPGAGFYISFSILVALVAMIRWGEWGAFVYVAAGIPMIFLGNSHVLYNVLIYPFANMFILLTCFVFKRIQRDDIKENTFYLLCYTITAYLSVALGKGISYFIIEGKFNNSIISYFASQLFNMVMVFIVLIIVRKRKGLLDNMNTYLVNFKQEDNYE